MAGEEWVGKLYSIVWLPKRAFTTRPISTWTLLRPPLQRRRRRPVANASSFDQLEWTVTEPRCQVFPNMFPWLGRAWRRNAYTSRGWAVGCKCFSLNVVEDDWASVPSLWHGSSNVMRPMTRRSWEAGLKRAHPRRIATEGHVTSAAKAEIVSFSKHGSATDLCN